MAESSPQTNNQIIKFRQQIMREYARENLYSRFMGDGPTSIIQRLFELNDGGEQINVPIVAALQGKGKGAGTLRGNEERLDDYGCRFFIDWARNAIVTKKNEKHKDAGRVFKQARPLLSEWGRSLQRDEITEGFMALPTEGKPAGLGSDDGDRVNGIRYEAASAAQRNTWNVDNSDRVLYGNTTANYNAVHATALATVDTSADKFSKASSRLMKRLAKAAKPKIKPHMLKGGREYFVAFHGSSTFADMKADMETVNSDARPRNVENNPIFQDGDLIYDGTIHVEIPEIDEYVNDVWTSLLTAGASSATVYPVFLCGQNAQAMPWGQNARPTRNKEDDWEFLTGAGIEMAYGVGKVFKKHPKEGSALKQWGVFTGFFAASGT